MYLMEIGSVEPIHHRSLTPAFTTTFAATVLKPAAEALIVERHRAVGGGRTNSTK